MSSSVYPSLIVGGPADSSDGPGNLFQGNMIDRLDLDILLMIFDLLLEDHPQIPDCKVLPAILRLVCTKWNEVATPSAYGSFRLLRPLFAKKKPDRIRNRTRRRIWANIRAYSKHVRIDIDPYLPLNWNQVIRILTKCKALQTVRCYFHGAYSHIEVFPPALHNAFLKNWPQVGLYITLESPTWQYRNCRYKFPISNLVFLKECTTILTQHIKEVRKMLLDATRLEVLDLYTWYGQQFSPGEERLPPVKHLFLRQYVWTHSPEDVEQIFDFSLLETLVLEPKGWWQDILPFLRSVRAEQFPRLKRLEIMNKEETSNATPYGQEVNGRLGTLVANLPKLEELTIRNFQAPTMVFAITEYCYRLRTLKFTDWGSNYLSLAHLKALQDACVNLKELRLPLGCVEIEGPDYFDLRIRVLCGFRSLEVLKVELFKFSRSLEKARRRAEEMMELVSQHKSARLSKMHIYITLILGEGVTRDPEFVFTWSQGGLVTRDEYVEQKAENMVTESDSDEEENDDEEQDNDEEEG